MAWASVQTIADMWAQSLYPPQSNRQHHPFATDAVASANAKIKDDECRETTQGTDKGAASSPILAERPIHRLIGWK
jgi:hypothetical protein